MMRRWLITGLTLLMPLTACKKEPDFNERYEVLEGKLQEKAKAIDAQISRAQQAACAKEADPKACEQAAAEKSQKNQ
ncbi:hypothetical protein GRI39_11130 [Altererythrobacter indicus]|uniref:EexN family lipoprotein n=1 Tax=Altericroceibacterium indicum TaxID=374177 RepID=A0A845AHK3_9SPHN|nr:hypothetical protein [Altericroceibacterium indicum]MXP26588.1 hypothetical protein [Altericroceibacterium indicum]